MSDPDFEVKVTGDSTLNTLRRIVLWTILLFVFLLLVAGGWYFLYISSPGPLTSSKSVVVTIPKGTSVRVIAEILHTNQLIKKDIRFLLLAKISGLGMRLQAGEFELPTGKKPGEILERLASAKSVQYSITIPEGLRASEIATIFSDGGWCDDRSFNNLVTDKDFINNLGLPELNSLEGYLFPDTYKLTRDDSSAEKIISILVERFTQVWQELQQAAGEEIDQRETVILASIVEKETGTPAERPLIAGVFHNRLRLNMRLQSDPTVIYGLTNFSGKITRKDLQTVTPFNTYTITGLPVGPICNPGKEALQAVLQPAQTKHLYFVSKNDGTHYFSENLKEHNRAVKKYQRKKTGNKGKQNQRVSGNT